MANRPARICMKCRTRLLGLPYLSLGLKIPGGSNLCIQCIDKFMVRGGYKSFLAWFTDYVKEIKKPSVAELSKRIQLLESVLKLNGIEVNE